MTSKRSKRRLLLSLIFIAKSLSKKVLIKKRSFHHKIQSSKMTTILLTMWLLMNKFEIGEIYQGDMKITWQEYFTTREFDNTF